MKLRVLLLCTALAVSQQANAAWFFFFPLGLLANRPGAPAPQPPREGEFITCVPIGARVGQQISVRDVGEVVVKAIPNNSNNCVNTGANQLMDALVAFPQAAKLTPPVAVLPPPTTNEVCVPLGVGSGERTRVGSKEIEVVRVIRNGLPCSDATPWLAEYKDVPAVPVQIIPATVKPEPATSNATMSSMERGYHVRHI